MRSLRRGLRTLLFAIPLLGIAGAAAAQTFTADINGDGVRDGIETRRALGELIVRLSSPEPAQHLSFSGSLLGIVVTDLDKDGDSDLVLATVGKRRVRMFVWTNAGRGKFVSRGHKARDSLACKQLVHSHRRLTSPDRAFVDGDLSSDAAGLLVLTSIGLRGRPMVSEPLHIADEPLLARLRYDRPSPRGPPLALLFS